jgi:hypothetical protein
MATLEELLQQPIDPNAVAEKVAALNNPQPRATDTKLEDYQRFVSALFQPDDVICIMALKGEKTLHEFVRVSDAIKPEYFNDLVQGNADHNIYIGMNAYSPELIGQTTGRTKSNVAAVRSLYLDADTNGAEVIDLVAKSELPQPTVVLESSPDKFQFMWSINGASSEYAEATLKQLATRFGTDVVATDVSRVLRIPGFKNHKYASQPEVRMVSLNPQRYDINQFGLERPEPKLTDEEIRSIDTSVDGAPIPHGQHDRTLYRIACSLRAKGAEFEEINEHLVQVCQKRCVAHGSDYEDMCRKKAKSACKHPKGVVAQLMFQSAQPVPQPTTSVDVSQWRKEFRTVSEMEQGEILMLIDGFLQEGTVFLGALPGDGKTLVALSIVRALTTGKPLFGNLEFTVKKTYPCLYLIPETGDRGFRGRLLSFQIPDDENKFLCRTISSGASLPLDSPLLLEAVRQLKPVVFLDTAIRFSKSGDENSAAANRQLVDDVTALRAAGAVTVVLLHHAKKDSGGSRQMSLENMLRGTGDFAAMCDSAYGIRKDANLYANASGPTEIDLVSIKQRDMINAPQPMRLAASYRKEGSVFLVSHINETGDFVIVGSDQARGRVESNLLMLVSTNPDMKADDLAEVTGMKEYVVKKVLKEHGWHSVQGGLKGSSPWHQDNGLPCPYEKAPKAPKAPKPENAEKPRKARAPKADVETREPVEEDAGFDVDFDS